MIERGREVELVEEEDVEKVRSLEAAGLGGTKNTNFRNSMGALSNPISFAIRISKQFLFLF